MNVVSMENPVEATPPRTIRLANRAVAILLLIVTAISAGVDLLAVKGPMGAIGWSLLGANSVWFARYLLKSAKGEPVSWGQMHYPPDDDQRFFDHDQEWLAIVAGIAFSVMSFWAIGGF